MPKPGGRVAILTFHSESDKLAKKALKAGYKAGIYSDYAKDVIRPILAQECKPRTTRQINQNANGQSNQNINEEKGIWGENSDAFVHYKSYVSVLPCLHRKYWSELKPRINRKIGCNKISPIAKPMPCPKALDSLIQYMILMTAITILAALRSLQKT